MTTDDTLARLRAALDGPVAGSSDFDLNPDQAPPGGRVLRPASVLVGVSVLRGQPEVLLTKRASHLKHHPGQIAFPGGKQEDGDAGPVGAALRETHEEVGLAPGLVRVLGTLPMHETVTGFCVTPVVALIRDDFTPIPEAGEVDEVFYVPLDHVADPARYAIQSRLWRGERRHYFTVPYGPYYIWGATARILRGLADRLTP
ncbi:CoA pyrophosphatase [Actibacterium sp. D379-3]